MLFRGSDRFDLPLAILDTINNCYELPAFLKWNKLILTLNLENNAAHAVMHDWRNFNNVSFESIMVILYCCSRICAITLFHYCTQIM